MATYTSQILIGKKHPYDSGIVNISHTLYLSENSRPAWVLTPTEKSRVNGKKSEQKIVWIPTLENMLEDALVMIGLYLLKDEQLLAMAHECFQHPDTDFMELYDEISKEDLQKLYERARKIESSHKVMLSVFQGSSISNEIHILKNYQNDMEVCKSIFQKEFSLWTKEFEESGSLEE